MKDTKCAACNSMENLFFHHLTPLSIGGLDVETNILTLCGRCHTAIHNVDAIWTKDLTKAALTKKKLKGERVGTIPYGHSIADDGVNLSPVQHEQNVIRLIHNLRNSGLSYDKIAKELTVAGIKTKKGCDTWWARTIFNICRRTE